MNQLPIEDALSKLHNKPDDENESGEESDVKPSRRSGRRKIKIEYIEDKNRRHITFSKRKAGIMKKAYELSTLTGTQVLLLVVSETGLVYTFTTVKLQPIVTKPEGKNLIQACLNAPDPVQSDSNDNETVPYNPTSRVDIDKKLIITEKIETVTPTVVPPSAPSASTQQTAAATATTDAGPYQPQQQQPYGANNYGGGSNYMNNTPYQNQPQQQQSPQQQQQQQQQQQPYGQMPGGPSFYGNQQQQPHYMQHPGQQHPGYWPSNNSSSSPSLRQQEEEQARRGGPTQNK